MENPELISQAIAKGNSEANKLADKKYNDLMKIVGLDK
jgi:hypothetical protein